MAYIFYYLLKVSVATTVFYLTYYFLFRRSKQYVFNRLYLIGSFIVSFIIPIITFKTERYVTETNTALHTNVTAFPESFAFALESGSSMSRYNYLLIIYLLGVIFFISKLVYSCIVATRIKKSSQIEQINGLNIYVTEDDIRAFTFLDKIIIGKNILGHPSLIMILLHESVHSKEKHFYDILMAELLFSMQWFNPFAWLHKNAIRNNLEFRADDIVIRESDTEEYQLTMLSMVQNRVKPPLFTELNSSNLKKRITMMKSENTTRFSGIARFVVIPVFAILLLSLSRKETIIIQDHTNAEHGLSSLDTMQSVAIVENSPGEIKSVNNLPRYIAEHIRYPQDAAEAGQTGTVELFARVGGDGMIAEVMEIQPEEDYVNIDEIFIVGYKPENIVTIESSSHESLITEGRRVINSFPKLEIPELYGKTIKLQFRFTLQ